MEWWNVGQATSISKHLKFKMPRPGDLNQLANCDHIGDSETIEPIFGYMYCYA